MKPGCHVSSRTERTAQLQEYGSGSNKKIYTKRKLTLLKLRDLLCNQLIITTIIIEKLIVP